MNYLPEFIRLMKDIRDNFFQQMQQWKIDLDTMYADVKKIHLSFTNLGVEKTYNVKPDANNVPGDAKVTYDPINEKFSVWVPEGPHGADGPAGLQGQRGMQGIQGLEGNQGPAGAQGIQGQNGPRGPAGSHGAQGITGVQGIRGDKGAIGSPGIDGAIGHQGPHGPQGVAGPVGPQGVRGAKGEMGMGIQFENAYNTLSDLKVANTSPKIGETHLVLFQADGVTPMGDLYVWSNPVPPHNASQAGWNNVGHVQGPQGIQGLQGIQGPMGPGINIKGTDTAANIATKVGANGDMWIEIANGHGWVYENNVWKDVGPIKGPKGDAGAPGPKGPSGSAGVKGPRGESVKLLGTLAKALILAKTGADGDMWIASEDGHGYMHNGTAWNDVGPIRGPAGPNGVAGSQGIQGPKGDTGAIGSIGPIGPDGPQGPKGDTGTQGSVGPKGDKGDPGAQGIAGPQGSSSDFATQVEIEAGTATNKVASPAGLKAVYLQIADAVADYSTKTAADAKFLAKTTADTKFLSKAGAVAKYLTKTDAVSTYLGKVDAVTNYLNKSDAASTYETKAAATTAHALAMPKTGGTFSGTVTFAKDAIAMHLTGTKGTFILGQSKAGTNGWRVGVASKTLDKLEVVNYIGGNNVTLLETGGIALNPKSGEKAKIDSDEIATVPMLSGYLPLAGGRVAGRILFGTSDNIVAHVGENFFIGSPAGGKAQIVISDKGGIKLSPKTGKKATIDDKVIVTGSLHGTTLTLTI